MFPDGTPNVWDPSACNTMATNATNYKNTTSIPPSLMMRAAQKIKLTEKSHTSFHDVENELKDVIKCFKQMELEYKTFSETAEDMAEQFGPHGQASHEFLRASSAKLFQAAEICAQDTEKIYGGVAEMCAGSQSCEPAFRRAHKKLTKASDKFERANQSATTTAPRLERLERDMEYAQIGCDMARTSYEQGRNRIAIAALDAWVAQGKQVNEAFSAIDFEPFKDTQKSLFNPQYHDEFDNFEQSPRRSSRACSVESSHAVQDVLGNTRLVELSEIDAPVPRVNALRVHSAGSTLSVGGTDSNAWARVN